MSLNIKNESVHRLVRELAELTGLSQTSAVEDAVRRRLDQLRAESDSSRELRINRILAMTDDNAARLAAVPPPNDWDPRGDFLYDESGAPQ